jgi:RNase adaptor protein for sRNA GlmZ degradation
MAYREMPISSLMCAFATTRVMCSSYAPRAIATHIEQDPGFLPFFSRLLRLLQSLLPLYKKEGKINLTIGIGCTGGRHRSVYVVERLVAELGVAGSRVGLSHRDLGTPCPAAPIQASAPVLAS